MISTRVLGDTDLSLPLCSVAGDKSEVMTSSVLHGNPILASGDCSSPGGSRPKGVRYPRGFPVRLLRFTTGENPSASMLSEDV